MRISPIRFGIRLITTLVATLALSVMIATIVHAANSVPRRMVFNSRLLNSSGTAVTTEHKIRFTFWIGADAVSSDLTSTGAINFSAANFVGWKEEQTFTPDSNGYFYLEMGRVNALPGFESLSPATLSNLFLQVEVKPSSSADSSYEILDPKPLDSTIDRSPVLSVPFALNADRLDQRDVGTGSGSIPLLFSGGLLKVSTIPNGTNRDSFTIDADNTSSSNITLKFGETLGKTLSYDITNSRFVFNTNVRVEGSLTVTGLINGVDITTLSNSNASPLLTSSGGGLRVNVAAGGYRINGNTTNFTGTSATLPNNADSYLFFTATGFVARTSGFPTNVSFIPLAKVTTLSGGVSVVTDRRVMQSDNRENSIVNTLHPQYKDATFKADGSDNVGQLTASSDDSSKNNEYIWTTTKSTLQDYDIVLRLSVPQHFTHWNSAPLTLHYRTATTSTAENVINVTVYDTDGNAVSTTGGSSLNSSSWTTSTITFSGSPVWTPGSSFIVKVKASAKAGGEVHIGDLDVKYTELEDE